MSDARPEPDPTAAIESEYMGEVDRYEWGPTEPDEQAVLDRLYAYDEHTGTYAFQLGDPHA